VGAHPQSCYNRINRIRVVTDFAITRLQCTLYIMLFIHTSYHFISYSHSQFSVFQIINRIYVVESYITDLILIL
jgi:hypothetical protein